MYSCALRSNHSTPPGPPRSQGDDLRRSLGHAAFAAAAGPKHGRSQNQYRRERGTCTNVTGHAYLR